MNDQRRSSIRKCIKILQPLTTREECEDVKSTLEEILCDEDESRDNIPESLQDSDRYQISEEASDALEDAISSLEEAINCFDDKDESGNYNQSGAREYMNEAIESLEQIDGI